MARGKKPTKTQQINILHDKLDEYGTAVFWLNKYMEQYGLFPHYHAWVKASAEDTELPKKLIIELDGEG